MPKESVLINVVGLTNSKIEKHQYKTKDYMTKQMKQNKNIIEILDFKYKAYLEDDGRWLNEGFKNIFIAGETSRKNLKTHVYLMLPDEIRHNIDYLLEESTSWEENRC